MPRRRDLTPSNRDAGKQMMQVLAQRFVRQADAAGLPISRLGGYSSVTWEESLTALTAVSSAQAELDELLWDLLGAVALAGAPLVGTDDAPGISSVTGISPSTVTRRLPEWAGELMGRHLIRDTRADRGWRATEG
ncbi:hypothetical protein [Mycobacteroides abscessus]|uniref:hypothetical protein n=2 Tax=Mycobacteroides abscessus TaxID=36809 RepID=UPI001877EFD8